MSAPAVYSLEEALQKFPDAQPFLFGMVDRRGRILRLHCTEVIRTVYRKRGVLRVLWRGRETAAKIYLGSSALRESRREVRAYRMLHRAGLPTPELLHAAEGADRRSALLLFRYLPDAVSVDLALTDAENLTEKTRLAGRMIELICSMHRHGLWQRDCHPGNFLFSGDRLFVVDLGRVFPVRLSWTPVYNLIKMLNRQPVSIRPALLQLLEKKYRLKLRPWQLDLRWTLDLRKKRRMVRDGRGNFAVSRPPGRMLAYCRNRWDKTLHEIAGNPDAALARSGETRQQKEGMRPVRTVRVSAEDGGSFLLQCHAPPGKLRALQPSRAWRYWQNSHLLSLGARGDIHLPETLACVEERRGLLRGRSWLVYRPAPGESLTTVTRKGPPEDAVDESLHKVFTVFYTLRALPRNLRAEDFSVHQGRIFFTAPENVRYFRFRSSCRRAWTAMQQGFLSHWPPSHPCHAHYRKMLESIPQESPF